MTLTKAPLTEEQLDELCGGAPAHRPTCPTCGHLVGPYYSRALALDALGSHMRSAHLRKAAGVETGER